MICCLFKICMYSLNHVFYYSNCRLIYSVFHKNGKISYENKFYDVILYCENLVCLATVPKAGNGREHGYF